MMDEKSRFAGNRRLLLALGVFELQVDARAVLPQPFETVVFAGFLVHDVDDEITVVEQHPLAFGQAFAGEMCIRDRSLTMARNAASICPTSSSCPDLTAMP